MLETIPAIVRGPSKRDGNRNCWCNGPLPVGPRFWGAAFAPLPPESDLSGSQRAFFGKKTLQPLQTQHPTIIHGPHL